MVVIIKERKDKTMIFIIIIIVALIGFFIIRHLFHKKKQDVLIMYSGSNGTGKTYNMSKDAKKRIKRACKANRKEHKPQPVVYSNFPYRYKIKHKWYLSEPLKNEHILMQEPMAYNNITIIDEFGSYISQFDYNVKNKDIIDEHIRMWRHYHGNNSSLLCADQCSNNVVLQFRRRFAKVINCISTRFYLFGFIAITKYRNVVISEEIKTIEEIEQEQDTDDKYERFIRLNCPKWLSKLLHLKRIYDDRAYSNRYDKAYYPNYVVDSELKTDKLLHYEDSKKIDNPLERGIKDYDEKNKIDNDSDNTDNNAIDSVRAIL